MARKSVSIAIDGLSKNFGSVMAVHPFSFRVEAGEMVALLGPSGCGKTTTLMMIAGLLRSSRGSIQFDDRVIDDLHPSHRDIGMVFQSYALFPHMTLYQNIAFPLENMKVSKAEIERRVTQAAAILSIDKQLARLPSQVSGGQQQRTAIARAIVKEPSVLLLDEPLSNLDAQVRLQARAELRRLQNELGVTSLLVTHDQSEALAMADKVAVFSEGRMVQFATPRELYDEPASIFVAGFVGHPPMNILEGRFEAGTFTAGTFSCLAETSYTGTGYLGLRPEEMRIDMSSSAPSTQYKIDLIEAQGRESMASLSVGTDRSLSVLIETNWGLKVGQHCTLDLSKAKRHVFSANGALFSDQAI